MSEQYNPYEPTPPLHNPMHRLVKMVVTHVFIDELGYMLDSDSPDVRMRANLTLSNILN
jgi:hypothetical protein